VALVFFNMAVKCGWGCTRVKGFYVGYLSYFLAKVAVFCLF